jgi:uncharacterized protein
MQAGSVKYAALCVTHNCNLRCRYCYAGAKVDRRMSTETAKRSIDFLAAQANGKCIITFFGGEPLLEFSLIKEVVEHSRHKHGNKIEFRMNTNGTLIKPEVLAFFKETGIYFAVSVDGNREQHDAVRRFADDRGSYDRIAAKLPEILQFNPYTIAVSVIVPETVNYLESGVRDLFAQRFRYVLQTLDYSAGWTSADIAALRKQYLLLAEYYFAQLRAGKKIYYSPFDERIKTWAQKPYGPGDLCDLANSQIAIAASGRIYPCVQFINTDDDTFRQNAIGSVYDGFDAQKREYFIAENYRDKESCHGCPLYGRCATYCGCVNWRATGSLNLVPPIVCEHERILMPIVDKLANKLWKNNVTLFKRKFYERTFPISSYIEDCLISRRQNHAENQTG